MKCGSTVNRRKVDSDGKSIKALNIEASGYGITVANAIIDSVKKERRLIVLERRELENFLIANDLQQNDQGDNAANIGSRMGLSYVIAGTLEKKGSTFVTQCKVISVGKRSAAYSRTVTSIGDGNLISDIGKTADAMAQVMVRSSSNP